MRNIIIAFVALLLLIPLVSGCASRGETDTSALPDQNEDSNDSLDARVEELAAGDVSAGDREEGEVVVWLQDGITEEEAYLIFASHGFERQSVDKQYTPKLYVLHFSEAERDIRSIIKELLLDSSVLHASANPIAQLADE